MRHEERDPVVQRAATMQRGGKPQKAVTMLEAALRKQPANRRLLAALADAQMDAGRRKDAFGTYNRLIALGDVTADEWNAIGEALIRGREYAQAIGFFRQSLEVEETAAARHNLGQALFKLGEIDEAAEHLEASARASDRMLPWIALATLIPGAPGASQERILRIRQDFAARLASSPQAASPGEVVKREREPGARIRVGYVCSWFRSANYMKPVWALINNHDRERYEVHLFSDSEPGEKMDGYEPRAGDRVHATAKLDNTRLARLIAKEGIDCLIDLNAYSTPDRLGLFVSPPAPVTMAWFNMYATSGLPGFHYIVGDEEVAKSGDDPFYSEKVLRLPVSYLTFTTAHRTPPVVDPPCLKNGYVTFGSLIAQYKITGEVVAAWARMLNGVPGSRLFLANRAMDQVENRNWMAERFAGHEVDTARIEFSGSAPHYDYLGNYDRMDFALDAFPYNGGTTTMEAIWQGVPVLTFDGDRWASRTSQTLLRRTHLGEFVGESCEAMVDQAIAMGNDPGTPARLKALRHAMRDQLVKAPVCDAGALARAMETLIEQAVADA